MPRAQGVNPGRVGRNRHGFLPDLVPNPNPQPRPPRVYTLGYGYAALRAPPDTTERPRTNWGRGSSVTGNARISHNLEGCSRRVRICIFWMRFAGNMLFIPFRPLPRFTFRRFRRRRSARKQQGDFLLKQIYAMERGLHLSSSRSRAVLRVSADRATIIQTFWIFRNEGDVPPFVQAGSLCGPVAVPVACGRYRGWPGSVYGHGGADPNGNLIARRPVILL
jgi:hypothetical protein